MEPWYRSLASGWVDRLPVRRSLLFDLSLGVVLAACAVAVPLGANDTDFVSSLNRPDSLATWLVIIGPAWVVPFRRIAPTAAVLAGAVLQAMTWGLGYPDSFVAMSVLLYSGAAHGRPRRRGWVWAVAALLTAYTGLGVAVDGAPLYALPLVGLFGAASVAFGSTMAARQAYAEAASARAIELERTRQVDRERALAEERARIARELHDVVAHGLSVIVVQAAAARRILDRDPDGAATALGQIETTGRNALGEMRHVLAAIRTEPDESWAPTRGLADLDALVADLARAGLSITVRRRADFDVAPSPSAGTGDDGANGTGSPGRGRIDDAETDDAETDDAETDDGTGTEVAGHLDTPLPATIDVTAYRIVRESLTNVLKHAGEGATATVEIMRRPEALELRVTDTGRGALADDGGGHGLRGMQERVEVFGGRFSARPRLGGGFTVEASLPLDGHQATVDR